MEKETIEEAEFILNKYFKIFNPDNDDGNYLEKEIVLSAIHNRESAIDECNKAISRVNWGSDIDEYLGKRISNLKLQIEYLKSKQIK